MRDSNGNPIPTRDYEEDPVYEEPSRCLDEALVFLKQQGVPARRVGETSKTYDTVSQFRYQNDRAHTFNQVFDLIAAVEYHCKAKGLAQRITTPLGLLARKCGYNLTPHTISDRILKLSDRSRQFATLSGFLTNVMTQIESAMEDDIITPEEADRINRAIDNAEKHLEALRNATNARVEKKS